MFWIPAGLSGSHLDDEVIWDLIDDGTFLSISRTTIVSAVDRTITLSNGTTAPSDVIILATGWTHPYTSLFPPELAIDLELAVPIASEPTAHKEHWADLDAAAKTKLFQHYPILEHPPEKFNLHLKPARTLSHLHHFRFLVPPGPAARGDRNIIFMGNIHVGSMPILAQVSAVWAYAYLENNLPSPSHAPLADLLDDQPAMERNTAWMTMFFRMRYLDLFEGYAICTMESRNVIDQLLLDLGVRPDRHGRFVQGGVLVGLRRWWTEWFTSYKSEEYGGVLQEYLDVVARK
jgi:dimethylaniline monooxygenase (N-oxide forming)